MNIGKSAIVAKESVGVNKVNEAVTFGGDVYNVTTDENGIISLMRLNKRYRMWVKISFNAISSDANTAEYIVGILSKQYIEKGTGVG